MRSAPDSVGFQPARTHGIARKIAPDTYKVKRKLPEPTLCPGCGAVYRNGCWQWEEIGVANEALCPACNRQHDNFPAGLVAVSGDFIAAHEAEIFGVVLAQEEREKVEHPLRRVMDIERSSGTLLVTTTDAQFAHNIGETLHQIFHGELKLNYNREMNMLLVQWQRQTGE